MKKILTVVIFLLIGTMVLKSQIPNYFSYQAVVRDNSGELVANQSINVQISIIDDSPTGTTLYTESHTQTTNNYGVVSLKIGEGTPSLGTFDNINWSGSDKFIKTEIDAGSGYVDLGTTQLLSVPFAFYTNLQNRHMEYKMKFVLNQQD